MVTIFSNPRPFVGPFDTIQKNAIGSWLSLCKDCEIILFEDEEGTTSKVARELGVECVSDVACDEFGTPLLSDVFKKVRERAKNDIIAQVNADIILTEDFFNAIKKVKEILPGKKFFMSGRRWDFDVKDPINFSNPDWQKQLIGEAKESGRLHGPSGMDYWVFPRSFNINPPPFIVGRPGMDSWLIYNIRSMGVPVIDATAAVNIVHQNHNYPGKKKDFFKLERERNLKLAGGFSKMCTLRDADWQLTAEGLERPRFPGRIISLLTLFYPWRLLLSIKRNLRYLSGR